MCIACLGFVLLQPHCHLGKLWILGEFTSWYLHFPYCGSLNAKIYMYVYSISVYLNCMSTPANHSSSSDDLTDEPVATERGRKKMESKKKGKKRSENTKSGLHSRNY